MSEIIPTPYDVTIENLEKITGQEGFDSRERQIAWWKDMRGAFRSGVVTERKRRDGEIVEEHPGQWTRPPLITCRAHPDGCPGPVAGKAELEITISSPDDDPAWQSLGHVYMEMFDNSRAPWSPDDPSPCSLCGTAKALHIIRPPVSTPGKAELRMLKIDAPGFKGEHTGRAKLEDSIPHDQHATKVEYSLDHDPKLGYMCPCVQCHRPLPKIRAGSGPSV